MKLYTEEQVKAMLINTDKFTPLHIDHLMDEITPIELPIDEEIEKEFTANLVTEEIKFDDMIEGAKWMRDKIQGDSK
jgi:hypothetical protein